MNIYNVPTYLELNALIKSLTNSSKSIGYGVGNTYQEEYTVFNIPNQNGKELYKHYGTAERTHIATIYVN